MVVPAGRKVSSLSGYVQIQANTGHPKLDDVHIYFCVILTRARSSLLKEQALPAAVTETNSCCLNPPLNKVDRFKYNYAA
jgi:hypothetical protein